MALNTDTIALISVVIGFVGMAWAVFWPVREQPGSGRVSAHWDIAYVNEDGVLQFTLVRVIKVNPGTRRMTAWCSTTGAESVFKIGKILKASDARSGARVNVAALMDEQCLAAALPEGARADSATGQRDARQGADTGGWWSASRLGLH